jgi:peptidyl-prolyl cis-trans isomerase B (cyclophilin B)
MPIITITMEDGGVIVAELYPDKAPNTVNNFISLAQSGYFNGKVFHRAAPGFMIQGGSPNGDGMSTGFPYSIKGEFANNGFTKNKDLKHTPGVLSMARLPGRNDSASCQFFIMHANYPSLDGDYATFGKGTSGMHVVDRIANLPADDNMSLLNKPAMKSVTVDLNGYNFKEPATLPPVQ